MKYLAHNICFLIFLSLGSCRNKNTVEYSEPPVEMPESFISFYKQFHTDSLFQIEHIIFPLAGQPYYLDDPTLEKPFVWQREDWKMHHEFDAMDKTFIRSFDNFEGIITETISDTLGQFSMVRRFTEIDGEWQLIFYKDMGL